MSRREIKELIKNKIFKNRTRSQENKGQKNKESELEEEIEEITNSSFVFESGHVEENKVDPIILNLEFSFDLNSSENTIRKESSEDSVEKYSSLIKDKVQSISDIINKNNNSIDIIFNSTVDKIETENLNSAVKKEEEQDIKLNQSINSNKIIESIIINKTKESSNKIDNSFKM